MKVIKQRNKKGLINHRLHTEGKMRKVLTWTDIKVKNYLQDPVYQIYSGRWDHQAKFQVNINTQLGHFGCMKKRGYKENFHWNGLVPQLLHLF